MRLTKEQADELNKVVERGVGVATDLARAYITSIRPEESGPGIAAKPPIITEREYTPTLKRAEPLWAPDHGDDG